MGMYVDPHGRSEMKEGDGFMVFTTRSGKNWLAAVSLKYGWIIIIDIM
jgi:hypothetical protein